MGLEDGVPGHLLAAGNGSVMGIPVVQLADPETNTVFSTLRGVIDFQVTRGGYASPGLLEVNVTADVEEDAKTPYNAPGFDSGNEALVLNPGEGGAFFMAKDSSSDFAYLTAGSAVGPPGVVVKVKFNALGPPTRIAACQLAAPEEAAFRSITVDGNGEYVYAVTASNPARVVKIRAADMTRVTHATVSALAGGGGPSIASSGGTRVYVATDTRLVQFDSSGAGLAEMGAVLLQVSWGKIKSMRGIGDLIYAAGNQEDGTVAITKFLLSPSSSAPASVSTAAFPSLKWATSIDLLTNGTGYLACNSNFAATGQATLVKFDIGGTSPVKVAELKLPAIDKGIRSIDADPVTGYLYALHFNPMKLIKVDTSGSMSRVSTTNAPSGFDRGFTVIVDGQSAYASTTQYPAAVVKFSLSQSGGLSDPESLNRWYPFLQIRVVELDDQSGTVGPNTRQYFRGRVDEAKIVEDGNMGRVWKITARDWLAALSDNFVDKGRWFAKSLGRGDSFPGRVPLGTSLRR